VPAVFTSDAEETLRENATTKIRFELVKYEGGELAASHFQIGKERRPVLLYRSVKQSCFGTMALVRACTDRRVGVTARC
jgi:hypothetical protein